MTTTNHNLFDLFNPAQLVLEIHPTILNKAWNQSQNAANPTSRWQTYLNQVALNVFLPWLKAEEDATAKASFDAAKCANIWEVVNGTPINLKDAKLVLIPSEAEDLSELRVPQEWIDIPEWAADYYLAVQVNVDDGYIRVWGYSTHQQLKTKGILTQVDRTYVLAEDDLITDLDVLWVARELCPNEVTQGAIEPLTRISPVQADNLIERLGSKSQLLPRLAVPFSVWAALIQNPTWCSELAATRRGSPTKKPVPVLQWLQSGITNLAEDFGWRQIELQPSMVGAKGAATQDINLANSFPAFGIAKQMTIANQPYELRILPLSEAGAWRFELRSISLGGMIPDGFKLRLLTESLEPFDGNEDVATQVVEQLSLEVELDEGESLVWQIEPTPDQYQPEVLHF